MDMKHIMIAPVGELIESLFVGIRDFPTKKVYLLAPKNYVKLAKKTKLDLDRFKIDCKIVELGKEHIWEEVFRTIAEIKNEEKDENIIVNTGTGDRGTQCAATSASFVNGLKAIDVGGNESMLLPIMKFSYYKILTDKKLEILKALNNKDCCGSLDKLSKKLKMSLPLLSYHINGNLRSEGLILVELLLTFQLLEKC